MLIRSQDKRAITTDLNMYVRENDFIRDKVTWDILNSTQDRLAKYSTEEKAIKVLDMIQNKYFEHMTVESNGTTMQILERPKVFQMPQDEEV